MNTQTAYNSWADTYDSIKNATRDLDKTILRGKAHFFNNKFVLEAGCGTGKNTQWISQIANKIVAFDFSSNMLQAAKSKTSRQSTHLITADLFAWPFQQHVFNVITINLVLEHIKDIFPIFDSAYKSLQTPGILLVNELHPQKQISGTRAHFVINNITIELDSFYHPKVEYLAVWKKAGFSTISLVDCFDAHKKECPRILSMDFHKV